AGALHVPPAQAIGAMAVASAVWYGIISYVAFHADASWSELTRLIQDSGTIVALVATALLAVGLAGWYVRTRRSRST
ncbi:MAG: hypothetical protein ABI969_16395, partial [bacterium]